MHTNLDPQGFSNADRSHMEAAITAARDAVGIGNAPFAAAVVKDGRRLHVGRNEQVTSGDCMAHGEVVALRDATRIHGKEAIRGATVYTSCEPCAMCSGAMFWTGISRVVYAATMEDVVKYLGDPQIAMTAVELLATASPRMQVEGPLMREEGAKVLEDFGRATGLYDGAEQF